MATNDKTELKDQKSDENLMVKAVVARGRTIHTHSVKFEDGGLPVTYGFGETVELPAAEVARLRKLGFLQLEDGTVQSAAVPLLA